MANPKTLWVVNNEEGHLYDDIEIHSAKPFFKDGVWNENEETNECTCLCDYGFNTLFPDLEPGQCLKYVLDTPKSSTRTRETKADALKRADGLAQANRKLQNEIDDLKSQIMSFNTKKLEQEQDALLDNPDKLLDTPMYGLAVVKDRQVVKLPPVYDNFTEALKAVSDMGKYDECMIYCQTNTII